MGMNFCCDSTVPFKLTYKPELVYADPPFNIGVDYGIYKDKNKNYSEFASKWVANCLKLEPKWFVLCIPPELISVYMPLIPLPYYDTVVWHRTFGQASHSPKRLGRAWTAILIYGSGEPTWGREESERLRLGDKRANPNGKILTNVWTIPMVMGNSGERRGWHPAQQPVALIFRILKGLNVRSVFDPFSGSGSTRQACIEYGRFIDKEIVYCGFDINPDYVELSNL